MAKDKIAFFCKECGFDTPKWVGKCPSCNTWNSMTEERFTKSKGGGVAVKIKGSGWLGGSVKPVLVGDIEANSVDRISLHISELDRVLGGGVVLGSFVLLTGDPGIGKSTLALEIALNNPNLKTMYVSGEESLEQIKLRADRLKKKSNNCFIYTESSLELILETLKEFKPDFFIIDSIQTLFSENSESVLGSVSQIKECAVELLRYVKQSKTPCFVIGHVTKDGSVAGPKTLAHIVDVMIHFEGDSNNNLRVLRSIKNRFGSTSEIGIFEMLSDGLKEVTDPSAFFTSDNTGKLSGVVKCAIIEGVRPIVIEIQALMCLPSFGIPQRSSNGFDGKRLNMLLAVIEKKGGVKVLAKDAFLNVIGGLKIQDTGGDLAVIAAVISSLKNKPIDERVCFNGEVGLAGEIRIPSRLENRIKEAEKLNFDTFVTGYIKDKKELLKRLENGDEKLKIEILSFSTVEALVRNLF